MSYTINDKIIETDPEGYLLNQSDWSDPLAEIIAINESIELET